jgi:uncharacterized repeat protein (TIGR03943 family)
MRTTTLRALQALILGATGLFFLQKIWSGNLYWYINARFLLLVLLAAIGLLILAQLLITDRMRRPLDGQDDIEPSGPPDAMVDHDHVGGHNAAKIRWGLFLLALPVLLGMLIPARPLGASAVANKGLLTTAPRSTRPVDSRLLLEIPAGNRSLLDWLLLVQALPDPGEISGEPVDVVGFVFRPPELQADQFLVGRFAMTCCVADAYAIGMLVHKPAVQDLPENGWVRVQGRLELYETEQGPRASIRAEKVTPVGEPAQPYLYP